MGQHPIIYNLIKRRDYINKIISVPISDRYALTIDEAVALFGIGESKLRYILNTYNDSDFILMNGSKYLIKRKKFENWLDKTDAI